MCQMVKINTLFSIENELSFLTFCVCAYHVVMKLDLDLWERSFGSYIFLKKALKHYVFQLCKENISILEGLCLLSKNSHTHKREYIAEKLL